MLEAEPTISEDQNAIARRTLSCLAELNLEKICAYNLTTIQLLVHGLSNDARTALSAMDGARSELSIVIDDCIKALTEVETYLDNRQPATAVGHIRIAHSETLELLNLINTTLNNAALAKGRIARAASRV